VGKNGTHHQIVLKPERKAGGSIRFVTKGLFFVDVLQRNRRNFTCGGGFFIVVTVSAKEILTGFVCKKVTLAITLVSAQRYQSRQSDGNLAGFECQRLFAPPIDFVAMPNIYVSIEARRLVSFSLRSPIAADPILPCVTTPGSWRHVSDTRGARSFRCLERHFASVLGARNQPWAQSVLNGLRQLARLETWNMWLCLATHCLPSIAADIAGPDRSTDQPATKEVRKLLHQIHRLHQFFCYAGFWQTVVHKPAILW
jgi:hypothetical protein